MAVRVVCGAVVEVGRSCLAVGGGRGSQQAVGGGWGRGGIGRAVVRRGQSTLQS
jgi:hypothetical protein